MNKIENRAWFLHEVHGFPVRVYVMSDRNKNKIMNIDLKLGQRIRPEECEIFYFNVEQTKKATLDFLLSWDFLPNSTGVMLANAKAKKVILEVAEGDCQIIPASITMYDGTIIEDYSIVNITTGKNLFNKEKSVLLPEEEQEIWQEYKVCYYNKNCLGDSNLAVDSENLIFLCSEKFRQAVLREGLRGLDFDESRAGMHFFLDE